MGSSKPGHGGGTVRGSASQEPVAAAAEGADDVKFPHALAAADVVQELGADQTHGLDADEVSARRAKFGENSLPRARRRSDLALLVEQFRSPLVLILIGAATVTLVLGRVLDAAVIFGVVAINAAIGVVQEGRAERALEALAELTETSAHVVRGGVRRLVPARQLVPGDLVTLDAGDKIPADMRLVDAAELRVNESVLTGESLPADKSPAAVEPDADLADRSGMAWAGTLVVVGQGRGIVTATGGLTEVGRIQRLAATTEPLETPLTRQIASFSRVLSVVIAALAGLTFAVGAARDEPLADSFIAAVALAVGAIPEGLPAAVTISLALGVSRMAKRNAIVRRLAAVETLGSTTTIGTDKTGTVTRNEMVVRTIFAGGARHDLHEGEGAALDALDPVTAETLTAGLLANDAQLGADGMGTGDPTEVALLRAAAGAGIDVRRVLAERGRADVLPFSSERQLMATSHRDGRGGDVVYVKGAPEVVIRLCRTELGAGGVARPIDRATALERAHQLGEEGMRVLAMARLRRAETAPIAVPLPGDLELLGLQGMIDPPRAAVTPAVAECIDAGISVKMITGDQPSTARAIASSVGVRRGGRPHVVTGRDIDATDDAQLGPLVAEADVFARATPAHKLRLVRALQADGEVVAMTGDGVNDAPALRQADIGIAMGSAGTDVAREASQLVLLDDDFSTIAAAVEEGRRVFDNITKFITWTLPTNLAEGFVILVAILLGISLPITPLQILWINMVTAVALGLMLAFEPAEPGLMERAPRPPRQPILTRPLIARIGLVSLLLVAGAFGLFAAMLESGSTLAEARTVAVNTFVAGEIAYVFNCRSLTGSSFRLGIFSNPLIWVGVSVTIALQMVFTYFPPMQVAFDTEPIGAVEWLLIVSAGALVGLIVAIEKAIRARIGRLADPG